MRDRKPLPCPPRQKSSWGRGSTRPQQLLLLALALTAGAAPLAAQMDWTGATSNSWFIGTNWSPVGPPAPTDDVDLDTVVPNPTVVNGAAAGSILELTVGRLATGSLSVLTGGSVSSTSGYVGRGASASGTVVVDGAGSQWSNSLNLWVGLEGTGGLTITDSGKVTSTGASAVGNNATGEGSLLVSGAGSNWTNSVPSGAISIGAAGSGTMTIEDGGSVNNTIGTVAGIADSTGEVLVTDTGSTWTNSGSLTVGGAGLGSLTVSAGATVTSAGGTVGNVGGSDGTATIQGAGSSWDAGSGLSVGSQGGTGILRVIDSGAVQTAELNLGHFGGMGTVEVEGAGSALAIAGDLSVGRNAAGTLSLKDDPQVTVGGDSWVAREDGSTGTVEIDAVSTLVVNGDHTHGAAGTYKVRVEPGGSSGLIAVAGGALLVGGTVMVSAAPGDYPPGTQFTILTAVGGVTGGFAGVVSGGLPVELAQDANNVYLVVGERVLAPEIPTLSHWGLLLLGLAVAVLGVGRMRRLG